MLSFRAANSIYSLNDVFSGYVWCSWVCLDAGEVFFQNFKAFGYSDSFGERIGVFSVGAYFSELIHAKHATAIEFIDPRVKFGKQEYGSLRHITLNLRL